MDEKDNNLVLNWNGEYAASFETVVNPTEWTKLVRSLTPNTPYVPASCCSSTPVRQNIIELVAEETVDSTFIKNDPTGMDKYIKAELALKLANKMIDEDLITIYHEYDISTTEEKFRAKVKIIQE